jgi:hypothetical protein
LFTPDSFTASSLNFKDLRLSSKTDDTTSLTDFSEVFLPLEIALRAYSIFDNFNPLTFLNCCFVLDSS